MAHKRIKSIQQAKSPHIVYPVARQAPSTILYPVFSFIYLQESHCISKCTKEEKVSFVDKMHILSKITWNQIWSAPHLGLGCEKIEMGRITGAQIPPTIGLDVKFLALRFHGKKPMVGFRVDNIFHIVWFDRNFNLYDHGS